MVKKIYFMILILCIIFSTACNIGTDYKQTDVVAIVFGNEITYKDIMYLNNIEDKNMQNIVKQYVIQELIIHEASELGITVNDKDFEDIYKLFPLEKLNKENRKFFENQANNLGMPIEEYYKFYMIETNKRQEYMNRLLEKKFGESIDNEKMASYFEQLLIKYKDDIEIKL